MRCLLLAVLATSLLALSACGSDSIYEKVKVGMSKAEVVELLGKPKINISAANTVEQHWVMPNGDVFSVQYDGRSGNVMRMMTQTPKPKAGIETTP